MALKASSCVDFSESTVRLQNTGRKDLVGLIVHRVNIMAGSEAQNTCDLRWCKWVFSGHLEAEVRPLCLVLVLK